jgi:TM2 domain-containing membrane protein YozV
MTVQSPPKNPALAAVLSFLFSGAGQIYNGQIGKGIIIVVVQLINIGLMFIIVGFVTYPILWIWSIYDAHKVAKRINEGAAKESLSTTKVCPRCAERVSSGAQVCHFCNYQFMPDAASGASQPVALPLPPAPQAVSPPATTVATTAAIPVVTPQPVAQAAVKYCPQCGAQAAIAANFCLKCGTRFEAAPAEAATQIGPVVAAAPGATADGGVSPPSQGLP